MFKKLLPTVALIGLLPLTSHAQHYSGNGATGFGGPLGNGSLTISSDATSGNITFVLNNAGGFSGNDVVVYIDSVAGGFADTSTFTDNQDGGREAVSGYNAGNPSRSLVTFAPGFMADYALEFENDTYDGLFNLSTPSPSNFGYITGNGPSTVGGPYTVIFPESDLGLAPGQSFNFVATLVSTTAYRSDETIGNSATTPDPSGSGTNAGFNGSTTFSNYDTYTTVAPAPEPTGIASMLIGGLALGGVIVVRRRRQTA